MKKTAKRGRPAGKDWSGDGQYVKKDVPVYPYITPQQKQWLQQQPGSISSVIGQLIDQAMNQESDRQLAEAESDMLASM